MSPRRPSPRHLLIPLFALLGAVFTPSSPGQAEEPLAVPTDAAPATTVPTEPVPSDSGDVVTPSTVVADDPFGLPPVDSNDGVDPIDGGRPIPDARVEIVHRWTITPEGANDPNAASSRSELSYVGDRGSVIEDGVTVFNLGNDVLTFRIYPTDAVNGDDGGFAFLPASEQSTGVGAWVSVEQEYVTLEPGMAATLGITITVPDDASPGDHVGGVIASSATAGTTDDGTVIGLDRGVGTRLYVRVNGPLRPELAFEGLTVDHDGRANPLSGAADVSYRIHNRGNVRLSGTHQLTVAGPFGIGRQVGEPVEFPEILPGQSVPVTTRVEDLPTLGWVSADVTLDVNGADGEAAGDEASTTALALPIVLLLLILLVGLFIATARRIRRHRLAAAAAAEPADDGVREHQLT